LSILAALALAYACGIAAGDAEHLAVVPAQLLLVQSVLLGTLARDPRLRVGAATAVAFAAGALAMAERREAARWTSAQSVLEVALEARVASQSARAGALSLVLDGARRVDGGVEPIPARVRLDVAPGARSPAEDLVVGDRVRARARLRPLVSRFDPGAADPAERLRRAGVGARGRLVHPALAVRLERSAWLRMRAAAAARRRAAILGLEERGAGLAAALAFGARGGLAPGEEQALRAAGLSHLLAVSGLNLAMVAGLAFAAARRLVLRLAPRALADPRRAALAAAWLAALGYAALSGFEVSVRRALVFLSVACIGLALRRAAAPSALVAAASLAVLAVEPEALFDPGAQLSFAAAAALLLARGPLEPAPPAAGLRRLAALGAAGLRTSAAALAATAPLVALHFGRLAPAALLANLVAVPLTELVLLPASLLAALLALVAPELPALAAPPVFVVRHAGSALAQLARAASSGPAAELAVAAGWPGLLAASGAGLAALAVRGTGARVAWMAAGQLALAVAPAPRLAPAPPRLVALDVGQGDAILVQGERGALLVDAGTALGPGVDLGRSVVLPALAALGVRRIDVAAASHADLDHRGGLGAVLSALPVGRLWLPRGGLAEADFAELVEIARRRRVRVEERGAGDPPFEAGDLRIAPLWPPPADAARGLGDNDRSLVLRVEVAGTRVLLAGDVQAAAERALLARGTPLAADVLKLPHHGSRTSSSDAFLAAVGAEVALASAPCLGRFGMPHAEVVERVARARGSLWWTGRDGALLVALSRPLSAAGLAPVAARSERWRCGG
jgi:competence protein ComEC